EGMESDLRLKHLLFYDEGPGATVSVEQTQNTLSLKIDGKVDASNSTDMINQEILAHLPLLMHPQAETVLVIGLGSGVSLGSAEQHPVRHLDCVELLKNVVAAADCFKNDTHDCLHDPRVTLVLGDGRNHVLLSDKKYDVIISEPTNVWVSGVGDLFTVEFFRLARQRLKPGGVMSAWFYTYHMGDAELRAGIKAFTTIFPHTTMWLSNESDLVLVGTLEPSKIDEAFLARMNDPKVASDLARVGIHEPADLLGAMLLNEDQLAEYARPARLHTDDNMLMEFNSGRRLFQSTHEVHLANIVERLRPNYFKYLDAATNDRVMVQAQARKLAMEGSLTRLRGNTPEAVRLYDAAYAAAPLDPYVLSKYVEVHLQVGDALLGQQDFARAREHYEKVAAAPAGPDLWVAYDGIGLADYYQNDFAGARDAFQTDITLNPNNSSGFARLGDVLIELADTTGAIKAYEQAVELAPWDLDTVNSLAWYYLERGLNLERALSLARQAARDGKQANYFDTLGCIYLKLSKLDEAAGALGRALRLEPQRTESIFHLALVRQAEGRTGDMRKLLQQVVALDTHGDWGAKARAMLGS
ncbi:MAG TPA: tetratricopeptide repeat protein, partial [bacterium]|nr:tetratricopeptide repeat protein [bacterium]